MKAIPVVFRDKQGNRTEEAWFRFLGTDGVDVIQEGDEVLAPQSIGRNLSWMPYLPRAFGLVPKLPARRKLQCYGSCCQSEAIKAAIEDIEASEKACRQRNTNESSTTFEKVC